jgi:protein TonB
MKLRKIHTVIATFFIVCFTSLSTIDAIAQNVPVSQSDKIVENPDIVPMFTGGTAEMHRFISNTLSYPADAAERNAQGLVVYTFVVEKDGSLSNFNIIHRADPLLNEEAW